MNNGRNILTELREAQNLMHARLDVLENYPEESWLDHRVVVEVTSIQVDDDVIAELVADINARGGGVGVSVAVVFAEDYWTAGQA